MKKSKAETLKSLEKKLKHFKIPKTYFFNLNDWKNKKNYILKNIKLKFSNKIAVRSSAMDEDKLSGSQAGKYLSFLNVIKIIKMN